MDLELKKQEVSKDTIIEYLEMYNPDPELTEQEKKQFIKIATLYQLNPFKREIYPIPRWEEKDKRKKYSFLTGYEVYLKRAERTGNYDGWSVEFTKEDNDIKGTITIYRKDFDHPIIHSAYLSEYKPKKASFIWSSKPKTMFRKVLISQGFRLAFPDDLGGMPYSSEEMGNGDEKNEEAKPVNQQPSKQLTTEQKQETELNKIKILCDKQLNRVADNEKKSPAWNDREKADWVNKLRLVDNINELLDELILLTETTNHKINDLEIPF